MKKPTWKTIQVPLGYLKDFDKNPATISEKDAKQLARSLEKFGHVLPYIAAAPMNGHKELPLLDGHQRKAVELQLQHVNPKTLVDVRVPSRPLTEKEKKEAVIRLRSNVGQYDGDALLNWYEGTDLLDWGMPQKQLEGFGFEFGEQKDAEPQVDRAAELLKKWKVKTGDLWQIGEHRLICGDCTDAAVVARVMDGERAKYGMHDPPYGIDVVGSAADSGGAKGFGKIGFNGAVPVNHYEPIIGDDEPFDPSQLLEASEYCVLWGANYYADKLPPMKGWIVWDKKGRDDWRDNFSDCELAWSNIKTVTRVFRHVWLGMVQEGKRERRVHPTQKPAELFEKIMRDLFKEDGIVIDYYLGSGTTLVACQNLNRRGRAIEISPAYCAVTLERMSDAFPGIEIKRVK